MTCNTSVTQLVLGDSLGWGVGIYVCTCRIGAQMLYAPSGSTEATAFGGTSSDVAVKENMVMLNKVESGGSIMLNDGLWILKWEIERSARERKQYEKRDVWVCVVSEGSAALALTAVAVGHRKGILKSYRSLLC